MVTVLNLRRLETVFSLSWYRLGLRTQCLGFGLALALTVLIPSLQIINYMYRYVSVVSKKSLKRLSPYSPKIQPRQLESTF